MQLRWLTLDSQRSSCLHLLRAWITHLTATLSFTWMLRTDLQPHAYTTGPGPFSQPLPFLLFCVVSAGGAAAGHHLYLLVPLALHDFVLFLRTF